MGAVTPHDHSSAPDFRLLFEGAPGLYLILAPDAPRFTIVAATTAYLAATMTQRETIVGRGIFEVFPDNPDDPNATGVANLRASLDRVCAHLRADAMAVQKYDIRRPDTEGGGFEERYWSPRNSPVIVEGRLAFIVHRVEDVTEFLRLKLHDSEQRRVAAEQRARADHMELELYSRAQELQEANRQLRTLQHELEGRVEQRTAELRSTEEQLRQAQRLEAIGLLAGGVAHDFNNLLTVVLGYSNILLSDLPQTAPGRYELEEIRRAGERAAELTHQLLAFSRQQVLELKVLDLNAVLAGLRSMIERLLEENVEVAVVRAPTIGSIRADRSQLEQVIMNLVVNARDALPAGGKLTIETQDVWLDDGYAEQHVEVKPGRYVMLAVSDNGVGMDAATQSRIFEPFFTTKEKGKGTGLGLSTVFGIVKQLGGHLWVYSEPGRGTTFKLYFPHVEARAERSTATTPKIARAAMGETILLVEDDELVRGLARTSLLRAGYEVIEARNGDECLKACRETPGRIDLLLTDVVMPGMNGRELAEQVKLLRPGIAVVFTSGYTDDVVLRHGVLESGVHFVAKPLTPERLTRKIREVLDGGRGSRA